ncbi:MAG: DNA polymerase II [Thermoprotei archaeon]|nr:MAG: DNA polymerase II [Thermoprotei archaeon]
MKVRYWLLDINYGVIAGNIPEIRMWGVTPENERIVVLDRSFRPYFYVLPIRGYDPEKLAEKIKNMFSTKILACEVVEKRFFGKPLKVVKVICQVPPQVPELREDIKRIRGVEDVYEADIRFYMRYMIDNGIYPSSWNEVEAEELEKTVFRWNVDRVFLAQGPPKPLQLSRLPPLRVLAFDIECYNPRGSPNPEIDPVIIISVKTNKGDEKLFTARDHEDYLVIKEFVNEVQRFDPDVIVGYNSNKFDWIYLLERAKKLRIKLNIARNNEEPKQSVYGHFSIIGRANVDLYDLAEEMHEVKVKTLENVAEYLGVMKKSERPLIEGTEIYKYWDDNNLRKTLMEYALADVRSTLGLSDKILPFMIQLSSIVGLPLDQIGTASVGRRVEWYLMRSAFEYNELIPNLEERPHVSYKGAIVLEPKKGLHENIAVLDFSAMYPNIMIKYNISPDTYVEPFETIEEEKVYITPEVGHKFRKYPDGFYRKVLSRLLEAREKIRSQMKRLDPRSLEYRILDERQKALKVIANATYGYCGWTGARWYKREVAEATTAWGRTIISETIKMARKIGLEVIYGDTDSIFVKNVPEKVERLIEMVKERFGLRIKPDKIYIRVFFTEAKKRYCGLLPDGRIDVVGLEAVRGDWSELAKEVQEKVIEIILKYGDPFKAVDYVKSVIKKLERGEISISKLIIWKTLSKDLDKYEAHTAHVVVARKMVQAGIRLHKGDKIGFVIVKGASQRISDRAEPYFLVKDFSLIDVNYYIEKQVIPAALRILGYFGIKESLLKSNKKQRSLYDFFQ